MAASYKKISFKVFKAIGHMAHYQMMVGRDCLVVDPPELTGEPVPKAKSNAHLLATAVTDPASFIKITSLIGSKAAGDVESDSVAQILPIVPPASDTGGADLGVIGLV